MAFVERVRVRRRCFIYVVRGTPPPPIDIRLVCTADNLIDLCLGDGMKMRGTPPYHLIHLLFLAVITHWEEICDTATTIF